MTIRAYSRAERKAQVIATLAIRAQHGQQPKMTMYQIAKSLDMRPSTHLQKILEEMHEDGELRTERSYHRPNRDKRLWVLPAGNYQLPMVAAREIQINHNGKSRGVITL